MGQGLCWAPPMSDSDSCLTLRHVGVGPFTVAHILSQHLHIGFLSLVSAPWLLLEGTVQSIRAQIELMMSN